MLTRAQRNQNPGNINRSQVPWLGENRSSQAIASEARFAVFTAPEYGYRALGKLLLTYQDRYGLHTVSGLINRWAPSQENNTSAYVNAVATAAGVAADAQIDLTKSNTLSLVVKAIAFHESGLDPFPDAILAKGLALLGMAT
jgi:hypothetical protein